jgi:hypothetical protein
MVNLAVLNGRLARAASATLTVYEPAHQAWEENWVLAI